MMCAFLHIPALYLLFFFVLLQNTISGESITVTNNEIFCQFTRQPSLEGDDTFYNISEGNRYFILLATGDATNDDGKST